MLSFSGDKLLGGIQAGILLGKTAIIHKIRSHPLYRAFRLDKVSISLLEETLEAYLDIKNLPQTIPTVRMLELKANEKILSELEKNEKIDKNLLRYLTIRVKKIDLETNYFDKKIEDTEFKERK